MARYGLGSPSSRRWLHQLFEAWGSVSIGLCGNDRLADFAAQVLGRAKPCNDRVAFLAGLRPLWRRRAMLWVFEEWADLGCMTLAAIRWERLGLLAVYRHSFWRRWRRAVSRISRQRMETHLRHWRYAWRYAARNAQKVE